MPKVVFHSLRHLSTSLKLKYSGGDIKAVQGDTGHATAEMVTDVYGEINPEDQIALADCFENNFFGKTCPKTDETDTANSAVLESFRKLFAEKPDAAKTLIDLLEKAL